RRYFYGTVWAVAVAQPALWLMWKLLPRTRSADAVKLAVFVGILVWLGKPARRGLLPRTRPIVPGALAVSAWRAPPASRAGTPPFRTMPRGVHEAGERT